MTRPTAPSGIASHRAVVVEGVAKPNVLSADPLAINAAFMVGTARIAQYSRAKPVIALAKYTAIRDSKYEGKHQTRTCCLSLRPRLLLIRRAMTLYTSSQVRWA